MDSSATVHKIILVDDGSVNGDVGDVNVKISVRRPVIRMYLRPRQEDLCKIRVNIAPSLLCTTSKYPRQGLYSVETTPNTHALFLALLPRWYCNNRCLEHHIQLIDRVNKKSKLKILPLRSQ